MSCVSAPTAVLISGPNYNNELHVVCITQAFNLMQYLTSDLKEVRELGQGTEPQYIFRTNRNVSDKILDFAHFRLAKIVFLLKGICRKTCLFCLKY